jgi:chemotaxis methyl-accepting protein methylase
MHRSVTVKISRLKVFGKSPVGVFLRLNQHLYGYFSPRITKLPLMRIYGKWLHALVRMYAKRTFYFGTFFFRNRSQLELVHRLTAKRTGLRITVLASSIGAEVYSILWTIRSKRPDLKVVANAVDISKEALDFAQNGVYPLGYSEFANEHIFASVTKEEMLELFDNEGDRVRIKAWLKEGIIWRVGDAADPQLVALLGPQDMIFANNFLCHMYPVDAERCLRNIVQFVRPGGYLFVSGIDLDVRTRVVRDLMLEPITDSIEDIHNGDSSLRRDWPLTYWGLEPFNMRRRDWRIRYSSVFRVPQNCGSAGLREKPAGWPAPGFEDTELGAL